MTASLQILLGPAGSGKTERLLGLYCRPDAVGTGLGGPGDLWLCPTQRAARQVVERLATGESPGRLRPGVTTFDQFARRVIEESGRPFAPLSNLMQRELVGQLVRQMHQQGRLRHFAPIADRPGLINHLCDYIRELKRLEIWPQGLREACQRRGLTDKDRELLAVYEAYQERLHAGHLYDHEGRFWWARELLQTQPSPAPVGLAVIDGFADFTHTQHEIIEQLVRRAQQVWITLPWERDTLRPDLFAKSQATLEQLQRRHAGVETHCVERRADAAAPAGLRRIEACLFADPREAAPGGDAAGVEILAAAQAHQEIALIGQRVKQLLVEGRPESQGRPVRPGDVAVVFRNLAETAALVRETFSRLGIPFAVETGEKLGRSAATRMLSALLQLDAEDWPYRRLLSATSSNYFRPPALAQSGAEGRHAVEWTIRQLGIPQGRTALLEAVRRWTRQSADAEADETAQNEFSSRRRQIAAQALPVLTALAACLDALPRRATLAEWTAALRRLAQDSGLADVVAEQEESAEHQLSDGAALERLWNLLEQSHPLRERWDQGAMLDRRDILALLDAALDREQIPVSPEETGRVRVLSAISVRNLQTPYLFLAGLSEASFPQPDRADRLYDEAETAALAAAGLPLVTRAERQQEELLLFYETVTRATRWLCLSYPSMDAKAQVLLPSPYLTEIQRLFGQAVTVTRCDDLSPVPDEQDAWSPGQCHLSAMAAALEGEREPLRVVAGAADPAVASNVSAGLRVLHQRSRSESFGPYEGLLSSPAVQQLCARRFGPEHRWSASQLERYAHCPFQFWLAEVLGAEPPPELELAVDHRGRGRLWHEVLATLHRQLNELHSRSISPAELTAEEVLAHFEELLGELSRVDDEQRGVAAALGEVDRRAASRWSRKYHEQHASYDGKAARAADQSLRPAHFEVSFGLEELGEDPLSTHEALSIGDGEDRVLVTGRIDRIDVGCYGRQMIFNVLDYKSSTAPSKKKVTDGESLQLPLYALAVERLLLAPQDAVAFQVGYWLAKRDGFESAVALGSFEGEAFSATALWQELRQKVVNRVLSLARGARSAEFPVSCADQNCTSRCEFNTVCRVHQVRSLEKQWPPPTATPAAGR